MVSRILSLGLRGFQIFCAFIVMALVGNMIASSVNGTAAVINYDMFAVVFAMASLIYLTAATVNESFVFHPAIMLLLDVLNTIWFFCGAIATAAILGVNSCGDRNYIKHNDITRGSSKNCREAQASTAFLFFGLFAFIASSVFTVLSSRGSLNMRASNPSMSQVSGSVP